MSSRPSAYTSLIAASLLVIYLVNGLISIPRYSITYDEGGHLDFGIRMLKGSTQRTDRQEFNSKMPVSALNALPRAVEQLLHPGLKKSDDGLSDIMHGRYVTLFISLLIGVFVFKWARELYGEHAALFSLFLFSFCPNGLAQAVLVLTDTYSVLALLLVMYYFWRWRTHGRTRDFLLFCLFTGIAQLVKQSLFHLYLIIPCILLIQYLASEDRRIPWRKTLINTGLFAFINLLVINAGFYFQGFGTPLGAYPFMSPLFKGLQQQLSIFSGIPMPLPRSFVEGLDMAKYYDHLGGGLSQSMYGKITLLGQSRVQGTFWYYYFVICFFKTPIPVLLCIAWATAKLVRQSAARQVARNELFLLLPVAYFFILMSFFYKSQTNIRQIIFIYPLLYIFCGILVRGVMAARERWLLTGLSLWYLISVGSYFGNYIPYTNEFIRDKKLAYRTVGAENLNMGQGGYFLQDYLAAHPDVTMATPTPHAGRQAIAIHDLLDIWSTHRYDWLKPFTPVGHIAHYYLIFDITPDEINQQ